MQKNAHASYPSVQTGAGTHRQDLDLPLVIPQGVSGCTSSILDGRPPHTRDIEWPEHLGVKTGISRGQPISIVQIYLNQSSVLITSMNLHESSSKNSMEICISTNDPEIQQEVRGYIASLMDIAQAAQDEKKTAPRPTKTRRSQTVSETRDQISG